MLNKRGYGLIYGVIIGIIFALSLFYFNQTQVSSQAKTLDIIGEQQSSIIVKAQQAESIIIQGKASLRQTVENTLPSYLERGGPITECGVHTGKRIWLKITQESTKNCLPDKDMVVLGYSDYVKSVLKFKNPILQQISYHIKSRTNDGILTVLALPTENIAVPVGKEDTLKVLHEEELEATSAVYTFTPSFRVEKNYDFQTMLDAVEEIEESERECKDSKEPQACFVQKLLINHRCDDKPIENAIETLIKILASEALRSEHYELCFESEYKPFVGEPPKIRAIIEVSTKTI